LIDNEGKVKICDFGISEKLNPEGNINKKGATPGTRQYKAPEQIHMERNGKKIRLFKDRVGKSIQYGKEVDIWAAGVTLFAMIYGHLPFSGDQDDKLNRES